jgi:hypothetical protein
MRYEIQNGPDKGSWYEIEIVQGLEIGEFHLLVGWGPSNTILEEKRPVAKGTWDVMIEEHDKLRNHITECGYVKVENKET